jgi:hypothetical protein
MSEVPPNQTAYTITPQVNATQEFIEIAHDFANPLDLVREAISNAFDAHANNIEISFYVEVIEGESTFVVRLVDDGEGMGREELQQFFDLGNSTRRDDPDSIGEKGHGTKVFFNAKSVHVDTQRGGVRLVAVLDAPFRKLHAREIPPVVVLEKPSETMSSGTSITIYGYNNNRKERFTHERLKDYIQWFTKFGSIEREFGASSLANTTLRLKGLDRDDFETITFGHVFPPESEDVNRLFDKLNVDAPHYYCRKIAKTGSLIRNPEIRYSAVFSVEGRRVKYDSNPMLRRSGYAAPQGAYNVQDRYGLWLCKDFIPIQRNNAWVTSKGTEFTRLHAFFNCQALHLTANRGSIENTPAEVLQDIEEVARGLYKEITESDEWLMLDYLEEEAEGYNTTERERKNFELRRAKVNQSNIALYEGMLLVEPKRESGVHALVVQLLTLKPDLFDFSILDYDTHEGIDVLVKERNNVSVSSSRLYYVEFKHVLAKSFNHSFENLYSVVCWDSSLKNGDIVSDINREERRLSIVPPENANDRTRYFLENPRKAHRIEVFVLKDYLPQRLSITFRPRTQDDIV